MCLGLYFNSLLWASLDIQVCIYKFSGENFFQPEAKTRKVHILGISLL